MKVLLIVLGSLVGLVAIAAIGIIILLPIAGKKFVSQMRDPATQRSVASKIAQFEVPRGYRVLAATDLGISQSLTIGPSDRGAGMMIIQLTGQHMPALDEKSQLDNVMMGIGIATKIRNCDTGEEPPESFARPGLKAVTMRVLKCADGGSYEVGIVDAKASNVTVTASDVRAGMEHAALEKFVASIK